MGLFDWFIKWREKKREQKVINQILSLLEGESKEIDMLKKMLILLSNASDPNERANIYMRFERGLKRFEKASSIIESLDKRVLRKTMFKSLQK